MNLHRSVNHNLKNLQGDSGGYINILRGDGIGHCEKKKYM
jgi:hypothetical protein